MVRAPLIGVTTSVTVDRYPERAYVNAAYLLAIQQAEGIPVPLPPHLDARGRVALWGWLDGLVLTEGVDMPSAPGFVLGVQWHPEDLVGQDAAARNLFSALVAVAKGR